MPKKTIKKVTKQLPRFTARIEAQDEHGVVHTTLVEGDAILCISGKIHKDNFKSSAFACGNGMALAGILKNLDEIQEEVLNDMMKKVMEELPGKSKKTK